MNRKEHLLIIAAEECNEVAQRLSKALRFGLSEIEPGQQLSNSYRIKQELNDLIAVLQMIEIETGVDFSVEPVLLTEKQHKVHHFLKYAQQCGTLEAA
jgi:hypothetical protein